MTRYTIRAQQIDYTYQLDESWEAAIKYAQNDSLSLGIVILLEEGNVMPLVIFVDGWPYWPAEPPKSN